MTAQMDEINWNEAACASTDTEAFYEDGDPHDVRNRICSHCPIRAACLETALEKQEQFGIWGGLTSRQRLVIHRAQHANPNWQWPRVSPAEGYLPRCCPKRHPIEGNNVFVDHRGTKVCRMCYEDFYKSRPPRPRLSRRKEIA